MKTNTIITVPKSPPDPLSVRDLPCQEEKVVLIYGGLGALLQRFLAEGFKEVKHLFPHVSFVVVDIANPERHQKHIATQMGKVAIPWNKKFPYIAVHKIQEPHNNTLSINGGGLPIHGVITAVPTAEHFNITKTWAPHGVFVWIEKPIVMMEQVEELRSFSSEHPFLFPSDFMLDSDAMIWFLEHQEELLKRIGKVTAIHTRLIESWPIDRELSQRVWLLTPKISGGGLGFDLSVHQFTMLSPILEKLGWSLKDITIKNVVMGKSNPSYIVETAFWCEASVGTIPIFCESGKGLEDTYYGIMILGDRGSIEICVGTEEVDPYLRITEPTGTTIYRFEKGQLGYGKTWLYYLTLLYGGEPKNLSLQQRLNACLGAVEVMEKAYDLHARQDKKMIFYDVGHPLPVPQRVFGSIAPEIPRNKVRTWAQEPT